MENRVKIGILAILVTLFLEIVGISINNMLLSIKGGMYCLVFVLICVCLDLFNDKVSKWFDKTKLW